MDGIPTRRVACGFVKPDRHDLRGIPAGVGCRRLRAQRTWPIAGAGIRPASPSGKGRARPSQPRSSHGTSRRTRGGPPGRGRAATPSARRARGPARARSPRTGSPPRRRSRSNCPPARRTKTRLPAALRSSIRLPLRPTLPPAPCPSVAISGSPFVLHGRMLPEGVGAIRGVTSPGDSGRACRMP